MQIKDMGNPTANTPKIGILIKRRRYNIRFGTIILRSKKFVNTEIRQCFYQFHLRLEQGLI